MAYILLSALNQKAFFAVVSQLNKKANWKYLMSYLFLTNRPVKKYFAQQLLLVHIWHLASEADIFDSSDANNAFYVRRAIMWENSSLLSIKNAEQFRHRVILIRVFLLGKWCEHKIHNEFNLRKKYLGWGLPIYFLNLAEKSSQLAIAPNNRAVITLGVHLVLCSKGWSGTFLFTLARCGH